MQEVPAAVGLFNDRGSLAHAAKQSAGGEGGIRTPDTVTRMPHFECGAFNHSATSPWPQRAQTSLSVGRYVSNARRLNKNALSPRAGHRDVRSRGHGGRP